MKCVIKGIEVECSTEEFKELTKEQNTTRKYVKSGLYKKAKYKKTRRRKKTKKSFTSWTELDKITAYKDFRNGRTVPSIAKDLGRSKSAIKTMLYKIDNGDVKIKI